MRSIWKGSISFGLVNISVAIYPATKEEKVSFKRLRKKDLSPIRYKKVAEAHKKEVPSEEIVKGYESEKDRWVVLEEKGFEQVWRRVRRIVEELDIDCELSHPHRPRRPISVACRNLARREQVAWRRRRLVPRDHFPSALHRPVARKHRLFTPPRDRIWTRRPRSKTM